MISRSAVILLNLHLPFKYKIQPFLFLAWLISNLPYFFFRLYYGACIGANKMKVLPPEYIKAVVSLVDTTKTGKKGGSVVVQEAVAAI
jgi:hypothetical protein